MKTSVWLAAGLVFASGPATAADLKIVDETRYRQGFPTPRCTKTSKRITDDWGLVRTIGLAVDRASSMMSPISATPSRMRETR
jgi:hypothetical protein